MDERFCQVGDVELCYETFGDPANPTALLIMGLGTQMIAWHADFCQALADRGFHVVRFDNRDVGRSTHLHSVPPPSPWQIMVRDRRAAAYDLGDLARDAVGLLDCLEVESAHVIGASMGGMIAQVLAIEHPERVLSLTSIMSTTGSRRVGNPALRVYPFFVRRPPRDPAKFADRMVRLFRVIGSQGFERNEEDIRQIARVSLERGHDPAGTGRQLAAVFASADRTRALAGVSAPTVVIHGARDRMVAASGGRATAKAIPGARLVTIDGMGHDLPRGAWPRIIDAIAENAARAGAATPAA
jgi:pimeloyl-ACP methyl ester carboxylesterase